MIQGSDENAMTATPVQAIVTMPFTPYYDQDGITIYNADYRRLIGCIDASSIVTSPPYGVGKDYEAAKNRGRERMHGGKAF